jgi:hypothetical protein
VEQIGGETRLYEREYYRKIVTGRKHNSIFLVSDIKIKFPAFNI